MPCTRLRNAPGNSSHRPTHPFGEGRSRVVARAAMGVAGLSGRVHLDRVEVALAKVAQHVMQWQGAATGADG